MKPRIFLYGVVVVLVMAFVILAGPTILSLANPTPQPAVGGGAGLANPASTYCVERGYRLETRNGQGGQYAVCIFPDGSECEEWAFFRGECGVKWQTPTR